MLGNTRRSLGKLLRGRPPAILLLLVLGGCGPTPGELLTYEMVLVGVGLALGLALWKIGYRVGRRLGGRWFVCSHCLRPQPAKVPDGQVQTCPACGQASCVNELDSQTLRELEAPLGKRLPSGCVWRRTLLLTVCTLAAFFAISCIVRFLAYIEVRVEGVPEWLGFPLFFTAACCGEHWHEWPVLGYGLYFYSYHIACVLSVWSNALGMPFHVQLLIAYPAVCAAVAAHWHVGLSQWRRGWLLPTGIAAINTVAALAGYLAKWPVF
jgi:hypothetical protein